MFKREPISSRGVVSTGVIPGYPNNHPEGFANQHAFDRHDFHLENGVLRDPAHPDGVPIETWLCEYARLNEINPSEFMNYWTSFPYTPK